MTGSVHPTAPRVVLIEFAAPDAVINANDRLHWAIKSGRTKSWRRRTYLAAITAQRRGVLERAEWDRTVKHEIGISFPVASLNHRRDGANWHPTFKACIDGLVDHGMLPDDSGAFVVTSEPTFHARSVNPRVIVSAAPLAAVSAVGVTPQ